MTVAMYRELLERAESGSHGVDPHFQAVAFAELEDAIDSMSWDERLDLRDALEAAGEDRILRNLSYDYQRQAWITRGRG